MLKLTKRDLIKKNHSITSYLLKVTVKLIGYRIINRSYFNRTRGFFPLSFIER